MSVWPPSSVPACCVAHTRACCCPRIAPRHLTVKRFLQGWVFMAILIIFCCICVVFAGIWYILEVCCGCEKDTAMVAAMMITCSFILIVGLSAGLTSQGAPNGGPGTGDFDDDDGGDDGGDSAPLDKSTVQFIVLSVSAGVLLILQGVSRANRSGTLPLLVEVIAFFSMLE